MADFSRYPGRSQNMIIKSLQRRKEQEELRMFDDYVRGVIDENAPGNLQWLMQVYPEYVSRHLSRLIMPLRIALRTGPIALLRYILAVARNATK